MRFIVLVAALAAACVTPRSGVVATPSGPGIRSERRPVNCRIEFYRTKTPERAYDEIATLHYQGTGSADAAQDSIRAKACQLGAHAVIVSRDYTMGLMTGTAVVYRGLTASDAGLPDPAQPPPANTCTKPGLVAARLRQAATLRDGADPGAAFILYVDAGAEVCAANSATGGFRQVSLRDGHTGYVTDSAVEILKTAPVQAPPSKPFVKDAPEPTAI